MTARKDGPDREITEIAQSLEFSAEDLQEISENLDGKQREEYLADQLRGMIAVRTKLKYNIHKLEKLTGQSQHTQDQFPF